MTTIAIVALTGSIITEVIGTVSLRMATHGKWTWWLAVVGGYLAAFTLLIITLQQGTPLSIAYGIWAAAGVALTAILSHIIFKEHLNWIMSLGIILITGGVLLIQTSNPT